MARLPRLSVAGYPHHLIQRGNNRQPIFTGEADRRMLLAMLGQYAGEFKVAVHAYVLMDNHFHLLATPPTDDAVPRMMQALGRRYVRYFNDSHGRSGTLWEGRYRSSLVQTEAYLLACMAYIDLNPVRAGLVVHPQDYPWSSYGHYAGQRHERLLTSHALVWQLGNTPFAREAAYRALVEAGISTGQQQALTDATLRGWALGDAAFLHALQQRTARRVAKRAAGRPRQVSPN